MNHLLSIRQLALSVTTLTIAGLCLSASRLTRSHSRAARTWQSQASKTSRRPLRVLTASATGQATHLGRFTRTETITADLFHWSPSRERWCSPRPTATNSTPM